ncbi:MAG: hypothetical protein ABJA80_05290 [bacterium]
MIRYRDFAPARISGGLLRHERYESFDRAAAAADAWITEHRADIVNIETVVLPNIWRKDEEGTADGQVETEEAMTSVNAWYQFVRVWYRE